MKKILVIFAIIFSSYIVFFTDDVPSKNTEKIESENSDIKVYIRGLDNFERGNLDIIKSIIEKKYGLICKIESSVTTSYKDDDDKKDCDVLQEELGLTNTFTRSFGKSFGWVYDESEPITIYNTNSELSERKIGEVDGLCYGNTIYLSSPTDFPSFLKKPYIEMSVIHELSHSFGMDHCHETCVMNTYFNAEGDLLFCEKHMKEALENGFKPNGY